MDQILWSMRLQRIRRFYHQRFWREETIAAEFADKLEPFPRLESVAEHSWHVADCVILLAPHFQGINLAQSLQLAVLHDKLELITGDMNPVGPDGTGAQTHAFSVRQRFRKELGERGALTDYLRRLRPSTRDYQAALFSELIDAKTSEARFVKAVDKLQALAFVLLKKRGKMEAKHLRFTLAYSAKAVRYFPRLAQHYEELRCRLLVQAARSQGISVGQLEQLVLDWQLDLELE